MGKHIEPLLRVHCIWDEYCDYPVAVEMPMKDGTVRRFNLDCKEDLQFEKVMNSLEKLTIGYQYKGKHRKSRIHSCDLWKRQERK